MSNNNRNNNQVASKFNVSFGIYGHDTIPANAAVLLNSCKMRVDGEFKSVTQFLAIEGVKSTKKTDLVVPVLAVMLADARTRAGFASDYKVVMVNGTEYETQLRAKSAFTKWLKGNAIWKSNSNGELNKALALDEGVLLRNTALKVTEKQPIFTASGDVLRVLLFKTAEAITEQATMFKDIVGDAKAIFDTAYATPAEKKNEKTAEEKAA